MLWCTSNNVKPWLQIIYVVEGLLELFLLLVITLPNLVKTEAKTAFCASAFVWNQTQCKNVFKKINSVDTLKVCLIYPQYLVSGIEGTGGGVGGWERHAAHGVRAARLPHVRTHGGRRLPHRHCQGGKQGWWGWKLSTIIHCEIILFDGHEIPWFDDDGHVRGHLNSCIFKLNKQLSN